MVELKFTDKDFYPKMKVHLNGEYGVVLDKSVTLGGEYLSGGKRYKTPLTKNYGFIRWDTQDERDVESWIGLYGSFIDAGGFEIDSSYKFKFINDEGVLLTENNRKTVLILDIDGVLITTPSWKSDEIENDGYSKFDSKCVANLNKLTSTIQCEIWLSSSRRKAKTLEEMNTIFSSRGIESDIVGFLPDYHLCRSRKEEITKFINEKNLFDFLIIDDDKSLNNLDDKISDRLVLTEMMIGLSDEKLKKAIEIVTKA